MSIQEDLKRLEGETLISIEYQGTDIDWSTVGGGSWNSSKKSDEQQKTCVEINGKRFYRVLNLPMEIPGIKIRVDSMKTAVNQVSAQNALRMVFLWDLSNLNAKGRQGRL